MEEKAVRKTTAKKVVRRSTAKTVPARSVERKAPAVSMRKAPASVLVTAPKRRRGSFKALILGFILFVTLVGVSALIGLSDEGQLNVSEKIAERKKNAAPEEQAAINAVSAQQKANNLPNGGLVGMGAPEPEPAPVDTGTTTDQTASSTEAVDVPREETASETTEEIVQ